MLRSCFTHAIGIPGSLAVDQLGILSLSVPLDTYACPAVALTTYEMD